MFNKLTYSFVVRTEIGIEAARFAPIVDDFAIGTPSSLASAFPGKRVLPYRRDENCNLSCLASSSSVLMLDVFARVDM